MNTTKDTKRFNCCISEEQHIMKQVLQDKHMINVSQLFRKFLEDTYARYEGGNIDT
jgi:hypothetical protein